MNRYKYILILTLFVIHLFLMNNISLGNDEFPIPYMFPHTMYLGVGQYGYFGDNGSYDPDNENEYESGIMYWRWLNENFQEWGDGSPYQSCYARYTGFYYIFLAVYDDNGWWSYSNPLGDYEENFWLWFDYCEIYVFDVDINSPASDPCTWAAGVPLQLNCNPSIEGGNFEWSVESGPAGSTISDDDIQNPTFTATQPGTYTIRIRYWGNNLYGVEPEIAEAFDDITINIIDVDITTPSSFPAYWAIGTTALQLDCTPYGSTTGTYSWSKVSGPGTVTFSSSTVQNPTFTADQPGDYVVKVEYTKESATATKNSGTITVIDVDITTPSSFPAYVGINSSVHLECTPLGCSGGTYSWTKVSGPGTVHFYASPSVEDPDVMVDDPGDYTFKVAYTVNGVTVYKTTGTITVFNVNIDTPSSFPAYVAVNSSLSLNCTSSIPGGTYSWTKFSGPGTVTFAPSPSSEDPTFSADQPGNYIVKVLYTINGATSHKYSGTITVIDVGVTTPSSFPAYWAMGTTALQLDCTPSGSTTGTYSWSKVSGPGTVTFSSSTAKDPTFTANQPGDYVVKVEYTKESATATKNSGTIKVIEFKAYINSSKTKVLEDWSQTPTELRSPKYIFGAEDAIYVEVKNVGNNPSIVEYVHVNVASGSGGSANLKLTETGPNTNVFDNITTEGELLCLAETDSTGSIDTIKVIDEEVLTFSIEMPPYNSGNYQESYSVKVDRGEYVVVVGSETSVFVLPYFQSILSDYYFALYRGESSSNYKWWPNGFVEGKLYSSGIMDEDDITFEQTKIGVINAGGESSYSCSDVIQYQGHGGGEGSLNISYISEPSEVVWYSDDYLGSVSWDDDTEFVLLNACDSLAWNGDTDGQIEELWIGSGSDYFSTGIHAVLGYCDTTNALFFSDDVSNFWDFCENGYTVVYSWRLACIEGVNSKYAAVVRESNVSDYIQPLSMSIGPMVTRDSTELSDTTTFIYYYYNSNQINYGPASANNSYNRERDYSDMKAEIDNIIDFEDSQDVDSYEISSEDNKKTIGIERTAKEKFDFIKTSDYSLKASRKSDKLSSDKHTIDVDKEKLKSIAKDSGLSIPDNYVLSSKGKMKAKRFGNGPGSGEEWDEGEVFNFVKKFENQTIFNDTCTIAIRNEEIMSYVLKDHPIQKSGKQYIKGVAFKNTISDIDTKEIKHKLVYEIKDDNIVPVWHVEYKNNVFRYNAVTGVPFYEN
ncbi:MAG: hypothetical protein JW787_13130 [Sedimentisphaerales bacterium]|nr:hypothetical protein [Sedimentisphaerales bacterium]